MMLERKRVAGSTTGLNTRTNYFVNKAVHFYELRDIAGQFTGESFIKLFGQTGTGNA